jgi:hypothetical protein
VVNALEQLPVSLVDRLKDFNQAGGQTLIIPRAQPDLNNLRQLASFALLEPNLDSVWVTLEAPSLQNPFFRNIFEGQSSQMITMPRVRNTIVWNSQRGNNYLVAKNGVPYLSSNYQGRIYLFGSPLDTEFTSLPQHAVFVPVMYKIAALSKAYDKKLYYTTDEPVVVISLDSISGNDLFSMSNGEQEIIPNQRVLGEELIIEVPSDIIRPGFYSLNSPSGQVEVIPYNNDKQESFLEQYSIEELNELLAQPFISILDDAKFEKYTDRILQAKSGIPLWKYAVVLALVFLISEVLLIRFLK